MLYRYYILILRIIAERLHHLPLSDSRFPLSKKSKLQLTKLLTAVQFLDREMGAFSRRGNRITENILSLMKERARHDFVFCEECTHKLAKEVYDKKKYRIFFMDVVKKWSK